MTGEGFRFGGRKSRRLKERLRQVQAAKDGGYGHRCITHDHTNPHDKDLPEHAAWEAGWRQADRDLNGCER